MNGVMGGEAMAFGNRIRSSSRWHPWQELEELWRALEQAGNRSPQPAGPAAAVVAFIPGVDLYDAGSGILIKIDLPGVPQENLDITAEEATLTISGRRDAECPEDAACLSCERSVGRFARRIELPQNVDIYQVTATLRNGVLEITAPKSAKATPEKVAVRVGN
jgi:HSP20 family protein